jgi:hypothetical protein
MLAEHRPPPLVTQPPHHLRMPDKVGEEDSPHNRCQRIITAALPRLTPRFGELRSEEFRHRRYHPAVSDRDELGVRHG